MLAEACLDIGLCDTVSPLWVAFVSSLVAGQNSRLPWGAEMKGVEKKCDKRALTLCYVAGTQHIGQRRMQEWKSTRWHVRLMHYGVNCTSEFTLCV